MTFSCSDARMTVSTTCQDSATMSSSSSLHEASSHLLLFGRGVSVTPLCGENSSGRAPTEMFSSVSGRGISMARTLSDVGRGRRLYGVWGWAGSLPSARDGLDQERTSINWSASGNCCLSDSIVRLLVSSACWRVTQPSRLFDQRVNR